MSEFIIASRDRLRSARKSAPAFLRPIIEAVADFGCGCLMVLQGENVEIEVAPLMLDMPRIAVLTDGPGLSLGPAAFHYSIARLFRVAGAAVIVACRPEAKFFAAAASVAAFERRNVVIIECDAELEWSWIAYAGRFLSSSRIIVCTSRPEGRLQ